MAVSLISKKVEAAVLFSICESTKKARNYLLSKVDKSHFGNPTYQKAWRRIQTQMKNNGGRPPRWDLLCEDSVFDDVTRRVLLNTEGEIIQLRNKADEYLEVLEEYRVRRSLFRLSEEIDDTLANASDNELSAQDILLGLQTKLANMSISGTSMYHEYKLSDNSSDSIVESIVNATKPDLVITGFKEFDKLTGGLSWGGLLLVAGTSGGGKSNLAMNLAMNIAENHATSYSPLEMTEKEMMCRILSRLTGIPFDKINRAKLTSKEKDRVRAAYEKWKDKIKSRDSDFELLCPEEDIGIQTILAKAKASNSRVVVVDYISLLKGVDGDDAWQKISEIGRICKLWAKNNNALVIMLAQLSEEGIVRYSRGLVEHATTAWTWVRAADSEEDSIQIKQIKARGHSPAPFYLHFNLECCYVGDSEVPADLLDADDSEEDEERPRTKRSGRPSHSRERGVSVPEEESTYYGDEDEDEDSYRKRRLGRRRKSLENGRDTRSSETQRTSRVVENDDEEDERPTRRPPAKGSAHSWKQKTRGRTR